MGSFGERLQREREMRGITLEEIAEATKIGTRSLRALEEQDFDKLPGGIFNKGFVRAYARYLGLDEDQAVADYLAALSEAQAAGKVTRQEPIANAAAPERILITEAEESEPMRLPLGLIAAVVVFGVVLFGGWKYVARNGLPKLRHVRAASQQPASPKLATAAQPRPVETPLPAQPPAQPMSEATRSETMAALPTSGPSRSEARTPQPAAQDGFVVRVRAKESAWVSIAADGKPVISETLALGAEKTVRAQHSVMLKTGNAAGIELYHNEKLMPALGFSGQVKTVEITASGLQP